MTRSNSMRKLVVSILDTLCDRVYHNIADDDALYPHIVFDIRNIDSTDENSYRYGIQIDLWDKGNSWLSVLELADSVEDSFRSENIPQTDILPTFYTESRQVVLDDDKCIQHIQIQIFANLYER